MEAIRKQATKLREQVARQQQVHIQNFIYANYLNYKYDGTWGFSAKALLDPAPVSFLSSTALILFIRYFYFKKNLIWFFFLKFFKLCWLWIRSS